MGLVLMKNQARWLNRPARYSAEHLALHVKTKRLRKKYASLRAKLIPQYVTVPAPDGSDIEVKCINMQDVLDWLATMEELLKKLNYA